MKDQDEDKEEPVWLLNGLHRFAKKLETEPARLLMAAIKRTNLADLSEREIGELFNIFAAAMSSINRHQIRVYQGYIKEGWRKDGRPPGRVYDKSIRGWWDRLPVGLRDHSYTIVDVTEGKPKEIYCAEPYSIHSDGIEKLAELVQEGWDVTLTAHQGIHYPGETLVIRYERKNRRKSRVRTE